MTIVDDCLFVECHNLKSFSGPFGTIPKRLLFDFCNSKYTRGSDRDKGLFGKKNGSFE